MCTYVRTLLVTFKYYDFYVYVHMSLRSYVLVFHANVCLSLNLNGMTQSRQLPVFKQKNEHIPIHLYIYAY